jgi:hypothetical protein
LLEICSPLSLRVLARNIDRATKPQPIEASTWKG